jgi:hypothetical protein
VVEQGTHKPLVAGSNPASATTPPGGRARQANPAIKPATSLVINQVIVAANGGETTVPGPGTSPSLVGLHRRGPLLWAAFTSGGILGLPAAAPSGLMTVQWRFSV